MHGVKNINKEPIVVGSSCILAHSVLAVSHTSDARRPRSLDIRCHDVRLVQAHPLIKTQRSFRRVSFFFPLDRDLVY